MSSVPARAMIVASARPDVADLLGQVGLDETPGPPSLIDADAFYDVVETIVTAGDDALPYRYASSLDIDAYGVLGLAFKTAPTLRIALERAVRYVSLLGDVVNYELRPQSGESAAFVVGGRPAHRLGISIANEGAVAAMLSVCRQAVGPDTEVTPTRVSFRHRPIGSTAAATDYFGCVVRHGTSFDALHLDAATLDATNRLGDDALSEHLLGQLEHELREADAEHGIEARVRRTVANGLADGVPPMRVAARRLAMSERTLHRRLAEEGLGYQNLVVDVRRSLASALLTGTDHSLVDIAFMVGFSDQSAFQRAFKRWTGRTPLAVRRA